MRLASHSAATPLAAALIALAGLSASAQPSELRIKATPNVILPGQSAKVNVHARFPATAYAFASASFNVEAPMPGWSLITGGVAAGPDVQGIAASQPHAPWLGIVADPANPYHLWSGRFTPSSYAPAFIELHAAPNDFRIYPNAMTTSTVPSVAAPGEAHLFINPVRAGPFAAAPGEGDAIRPAAGSFVASDVDDDQAILMGLLLPAVQKVREAASTVSFDTRPTSLSVEAQARGDVVPTDTLSVNFTKVTFRSSANDPERYEMCTETPPGSEARAFLVMPDGSREEIGIKGGKLAVKVEGVPGLIATKADHNPQRGVIMLGWHFSNRASSGHPGGMNALMADGSVRFVRSVVVETSRPASPSQNNLRQLGLAFHSYEASGVGSMTVTPSAR